MNSKGKGSTFERRVAEAIAHTVLKGGMGAKLIAAASGKPPEDMRNTYRQLAAQSLPLNSDVNTLPADIIAKAAVDTVERKNANGHADEGKGA